MHVVICEDMRTIIEYAEKTGMSDRQVCQNIRQFGVGQAVIVE